MADPALGLRKIPRKEFEQNWSGYAALFDYTVAFAKRSGKQTGARLDPAVPDQVPHPSPAGDAARGRDHVSSNYSFPIFTEMVVDKVIVEKDIGLLKTILLGMGAALFSSKRRRSRRNICSPSPPSGSTPRSSIS